MIYIIIILFATASDRLLKWYAANTLESGQTIRLVPGILRLTYAENTGIAFSMLSENNMRWVLVALSVAGAIIFIVFLSRRETCTPGRVGAAMFLGGALGNLIDRVVAGYVVDMLEFEFVSFAIFNLADTYLTVGAVLFIIFGVLNLNKRPGTSKSDNSAELEKIPLLYQDDELTETRILEEYDIERLMSKNDGESGVETNGDN